MRPLTAPQRAVLAGRHVKHYGRVEVQNESGTWINLSADPVSGIDWVDDCAFSSDIDQPVAGGTLTVKREADDGTLLLSLAPFMTTSPLNVDDLAAYSPLIHPGRGFRIWHAAATGAEPAFPGASWHKIFDGRLDRPQWGPGHDVVVQFRDPGSWLADRIIEEERKYGATTGIAVEDVMRQILDDNGFQSVTIVLPNGSPGWMLRPYKQARVPVLEALRALASQIGWDIRYRWGAGDDMEFQFYDPGRTAVFANLTNGVILGPDEYSDVTDLQIGDEDVRNVGKLKFIDGATGTPDEVTATDPASIAVFRRRYIEIGEGDSSNIDTKAEAQAMIDAVIADLSTPFADHAVDTFCLWPLELGDQIQFDPNDVHYNDAQTYAIVQIRIHFTSGHFTSSIKTRGKPAGGYRQWILKHGIGPADPDGVPSPTFTYLLGEFSHGGGVTGDGATWIGLGFEPNTDHIVLLGEEGDDERTPTPDLSENAVCCIVRRQEGVDASDPYWSPIVMVATRPGRWRKMRGFGVSAKGKKGPDWIPPAVQAVDPIPTPIDGEIASFSIAAGQLDTNILAVTPGTIDPAGGNFIIVMRDGVNVIPPIFIDDDNSPKFISDVAINPNAQYTYETFIWNNGVSGKRRRYIVGLPAAPAFEWDKQAPKLEWDIGVGTYLVALYWQLTGFPTADHVVIETGIDGVNFVDLDETSVLSTLYADLNTRAKWYRLRLEAADDSILAYSTPKFFAGRGPVHVHGPLVLPVWNPEPRGEFLRSPTLSIGVASLVVGFICNTANAVTCAIEESDDNGVTDAWSVTYESAQLTGDKWYGGPGVPSKYFRLTAKNAAGVALVSTPGILWPGFV